MSTTLSQRILGRLGDRPARMAFSLSNTGIMRHHLGRRYSRLLDRHRPSLPSLNGLDQAIVEGLERDGLFITSLDALGLPGSAEMLRSTQEVAKGCAENARREARLGREFIHASASSMMGHPEIFQWGLNKRMLDIAEAYIGLPAAYDGMTLIYTVADGTELGTRQWHRDREDRKMVKVAVYCADVTDQGGPFQLISRVDHLQGVGDRYQFEFGTPDVLDKRLGHGYEQDIVSCPGPAGTVVFADTARFFHRGAPTFDKDRAALFYSYFANRTRHPYFCQRSGLTRRQITDLVEGMSAHQRASALWHNALPPWLRLIPPAPV